MQLLYNIDFEISAALFLAFLALYVRQQFEFTIQKNRLFLRLLLLVIGANLADVITAVTISYGSVIPPWVNMILNTLYCILNMSLGFCFLAYTRSDAFQQRGQQQYCGVDHSDYLHRAVDHQSFHRIRL